MSKQEYSTNLFKANALKDSRSDDDTQRLLGGGYRALKEYKNFLLNSCQVVQRQGAFSLKVQPDLIKEELRFYFKLDNLSKNQFQRVENELFRKEIKYLFSKLPSVQKRNADRIKILKINREERYLILDTEEQLKEVFFESNDYQLRKQIEAIEELMYRPKQHQEALLRLFDRSESSWKRFFHGTVESPAINNWKILKDTNFDGTEEQRAFVEKALRTPDFAILEGPPGSGKTTAIIELIIQLIEQGKRVLLVSATHVAVDNVIHRILTSYREHCEGTVVPIRIANDGSIRKESVEPFQLQKFVKTTKNEIRKSISNRQNNKARKTLFESLTKGKDSDLMKEVILNSANLVGGTMMGILQYPGFKNGKVNDLFDVMIVDESSKVTFLDFIVPARFAKKWILVGDVNQLSPYVEDDYVSESIEQLIEVKEEKEKILEGFELKKKLYAPKYNDGDLKIFFSDYHDVNDFHEIGEVFKITKDFKATPENILTINSMNILICENDAFCKKIIRDYVFVKSQLFEGEIEKSSFRNRQKYFHKYNSYRNRKSKIGNYNWFEFKQRNSEKWGDLVASKLSRLYEYRMNDGGSIDNRVERDLKILVPEGIQGEVDSIRKMALPSILELLQVGVGETKTKGGHAQKSILYEGFNQDKRILDLKFQSLSYQHRMEDSIAGIPRSFFYKGKNLKTANTVGERTNFLKNYKSGEDAVIWSFNNDKTFRKKDKNINPTEVDEIEKELLDFLAFARNNPKLEDGEKLDYEIAVLTFYRQQEYELKITLRAFCNQHRRNKFFSIANLKITLCTVDKFQGDEADMVLLSFVKNTKGAFYNSPNRLNVALTRARYKLVLFGNRKLKENAPSEALRALAAEFENRIKSK